MASFSFSCMQAAPGHSACTSRDGRWEWALLVLLFLARALWRAKWNSKAPSQCTITGIVLPHLRLC